MRVFYRTIESPIGPIAVFEAGEKLIKIELHADRSMEEAGIDFIDDVTLVDKSTPLLKKAEKQLGEYFSGRRKKFSLPIKMYGTDFQIKAWKALLRIPYGKTVSYSEQADKIGGKRYARAVGQANGGNPLPIIVPCHRVIGSGGDLTGFRSGVEVKRRLLELEGAL